MAHMLKKDKRVTFKPGHPSVPAYGGRPWLPARTAQETQQVCGYTTSAQYSSIVPAATYTTSVTTPGTTTVEKVTSNTDETKVLLTFTEAKAKVGLTEMRKVIFPYFGITLDAKGNVPQGTNFVQPTLVLPMRGQYVELVDYNNAVTAAYAAYSRANTIYYAAKSGNVSQAMYDLFVKEAKTGWYSVTSASTTTTTTTTTTPGTTTYNTVTATVPPPVGTGWIKVPANPLTGEPEKYIQVLLDKDGKPTSGAVSYNYVYSCVDKIVTVNYPEQSYIPPRAAIEGTPSQSLIDLNLGWNAGARSVGFLRGAGKVKFKVPQGVIGAVVGINDAGVDPGYTNIENAWYFSSGIARIFESGAETFYTGPYITGDVFAVKRVNGIVSYWKNDALVYTSVNLNTAEVFLDASLYAGDDLVYDPEFIELMFGGGDLQPLYGASGGHAVLIVGGSDGYLQPMTSIGGVSATMVGEGADVWFEPLDGVSSGYAYFSEGHSAGSLLPLTGSSYPASRSNASLAPLVGLGSDRIYGQSDVSLEPLEVETTGGMPMPSFSIANTAILYLTGGSTGLTGEIGGSNASLPPLDGLSSGDDNVGTLMPYGESEGSLLPLMGVGYGYEGNLNATMVTSTGMFVTVDGPIERFVVMNSDLTMATYIAVVRQVDGAMTSTVSMLTEMDVLATLEAVMTSLVMMSFGVPVFDDISQSWVVNANTGASSRYEDYPFNSFGKIGKSYYGCKSDGLYLLEGSADGVAPIHASVNFGNSNFGTSLLKGCTNAYLGLSSTGNMYLKVTVDDKEYIYAARASSETMKTQRVDMGRGIRASYLQFELYNNEGCDFELDSVEFLVVPLSRRI